MVTNDSGRWGLSPTRPHPSQSPNQQVWESPRGRAVREDPKDPREGLQWEQSPGEDTEDRTLSGVEHVG